MLVLEFIFSKVAGLQPWTLHQAFSEAFTKIRLNILLRVPLNNLLPVITNFS